MNPTEVKLIKTESWPVQTLASKVNQGEIYKPKFQRKRKWLIQPNPRKHNTPSEKNYIDFLYRKRNSVHSITFGHYGAKLSNIDGNNRINAIMHYLNEPFALFPEKLDDLIQALKDNIDKEFVPQVVAIVKKMSYSDIITFKYCNYFLKSHSDLYKNHLKQKRDEIEVEFDKLIEKMLINQMDRFDNTVMINVNIFSGYTTEELAEVFGEINQFSSNLTEQDALASKLYNVKDFVIEDKHLVLSIKENIKQYYENRHSDEILSCYVYDNDELNAFDFMIGFQDYSHSKCPLIETNDNDNLSLFFKIYKIIFKESTFTTENVNKFINYIEKVILILKEIETKLFMKNLINKHKIFDSVNTKINSLQKNNWYLIIISVIGAIEQNVNDDVIINSIETCILYHFFVTSLSDKDMRKTYNLINGISFEAGGHFIDNKARDYLKNPMNISKDITREKMEVLLKTLVSENTNSLVFETRPNGKDKKDKRRQRKLHEKVLIYNYYMNKVPVEYLKNEFEVEHICPFSSTWVDDVDIDRLGNIFPILKDLNQSRSNKHLKVYDKLDKHKFLKFIEYIPTTDEYDKMISHAERKPHITNSAMYNEFCSNNETMLIDCFLDKLFTL